MMKQRMRGGRALWAPVLAAVAALGCAEERNPMAQKRLMEMTPRQVAGGAVPQAGGAAAIEPATVRGSRDLTYLERLLELRKHYDLLPWFEPITAGTPGDTGPAGVVFPAGSVAFDTRLGIRSRTYSMLAEELLFWGVHVEPGVGFVGDRPHANIAEYQGKRPEHQPAFVRDDLLLGQLSFDLNRYRGGLFLPAGVDQTLSLQLLAAVAANRNVTFYPTYRGYRLYDKGSQRPVQLTYEEYAARGYGLAWFPLTVTLTLPVAPSVTEAPFVDLLFPENMVIDTVLVETNSLWSGLPADPQQFHGNLLAKIEPVEGQPLQGGWVSLPAVGYGNSLTSAHWRIPYTVAKDTFWRFRARKAYDDNGAGIPQVTVNFTLLGSILVPPGR